MAKQRKKRKQKGKPKRKPWGVIWEIPGALCTRIKPILEAFWPRKRTGRPPADWRKILNAILFRMRTGCHWNQLPERFGPKSTIHDWFQRWNRAGIMAKIMAILIEECDEAGGVQWEWQAADGAMAKARFGGIKSARTPRIAAKRAPNAA